MRIEDRLPATIGISLSVPLGHMALLHATDQMAFSLLLAGWFVLDAILQYSLLLFLRGGQLRHAQFTRLFYATALVIGLPATVLCTYNGLAAEFRLIPLLFLLLQSRQIGRTLYAALLFLAGILLLYPWFSGQTEFLLGALFRPFVLSMLVFFLLPVQRRQRIRLFRARSRSAGFPRRDEKKD